MVEPTHQKLATYLDAAFEFQGLAVDARWRDEVVAHFQAIEAANRRVSAVTLDDEVEAAPIFRS